MKKCSYSKCGKEFEPLKPKAIYCSPKCRVYGNREKNIAELAIGQKEVKKPDEKVEILPTENKVTKTRQDVSDFWKKRMADKLGIK